MQNPVSIHTMRAFMDVALEYCQPKLKPLLQAQIQLLLRGISEETSAPTARKGNARPYSLLTNGHGTVHLTGLAQAAELLGISVSSLAPRLSKAGGKLQLTRNDPDTGNPSVELTLAGGHVGTHNAGAADFIKSTTARLVGRPSTRSQRAAAEAERERRISKAMEEAGPNANRMSIVRRLAESRYEN